MNEPYEEISPRKYGSHDLALRLKTIITNDKMNWTLKGKIGFLLKPGKDIQ